MPNSSLKDVAGKDADFVLEVETRTFDIRRAEFQQQYPGKFIVLHGDHFVGAFDDENTAIREAMRLFGSVPCLIKNVDALPVSLRFME